MAWCIYNNRRADGGLYTGHRYPCRDTHGNTDATPNPDAQPSSQPYTYGHGCPNTHQWPQPHANRHASVYANS